MPLGRSWRKLIEGSLEADVRELVEELLAERALVKPGVIEELNAALSSDAPPPSGDSGGGIEQDIAQLRRDVAETMGSIQGFTTALGTARQEVTSAVSLATEASKSAVHAAELATDGSDRMARIAERLDTLSHHVTTSD